MSMTVCVFVRFVYTVYYSVGEIKIPDNVDIVQDNNVITNQNKIPVQTFYNRRPNIVWPDE